ncbi:hypothetical protein PC115_g4442 [Phytophthora cactorum]|uniref:Uncharacterized protein n=1 Tax=Phytophthora cactorum TaxID=29920 RepID=A0A8T1DAQ1_9STRA|nr:hypothetical protein PC115_g4442 [Phytophthora cactorum]
MLMRATSVLAAVSLPVALVSGTASQLDYPACAINHSPQYYCCDLGTPEGSDVSNGLVYVRYNKPQGDGFSSYYDEGWQKSRQINYDPDGDVSLYAPSTPSYVYGEADKTCRLHDVAVNGAVVTTLQCTFAANNDDIYIQNTSLAEDSTDTSVFWSSTPNPRNNNASLPIGAVCRSIMLDDGTVNTTAQSLCTSASSPPVYRFNSFTETPLVVVYAIYAVCFISLACWAGLRTVLGVHQSSDATAPMTSIADGDKKLLDHRGGPETPVFKASATRPSLADRPSEVQLRNSTEDIVQTGYTDSVVGYVVFGYFVLMTVLLNIPIILTIRDNQGKLATDKYAAWFNPTTVVIKVFISLWVIATVWFVVVVVYRFKILNFFRYPTALDKCTRVLMYKPEVTETMLVDRSGVAQMVLKIESFLFPHSRQGVEETVTVHTTTEGTRYLEFQHLRYSFDDVEGKFIPGSVVLPDSYDKILSDSQGLTSDEHARRLDVVGRNAIEMMKFSLASCHAVGSLNGELVGRGALATSFASVKYLILYGLIGIGCRTVMYYNGVFISQFGFMYLDGAILVGLSYGLTRARPLAKMGSQRPTSSLVGPTTVCSMVGAAVIHWLFLYGAIHDLTTQPWYCPFQPSNVNLVQWWLLQDSNLGSTLWFIICFQQMSTGLTMGLGSRFRRPIWHNVFLLFWYALLLVVLVVMFVGPPSRFSDQFRVASSTNVVGLPDIPLPVDFRWELFGWGIADTAAVLIFEYFFVLGYVRDYFRAKYHRDALPMKL